MGGKKTEGISDLKKNHKNTLRYETFEIMMQKTIIIIIITTLYKNL
jgi:hypothetical protein